MGIDKVPLRGPIFFEDADGRIGQAEHSNIDLSQSEWWGLDRSAPPEPKTANTKLPTLGLTPDDNT